MSDSGSGWARPGWVRAGARILLVVALVGAAVSIIALLSGDGHDRIYSQTIGTAVALAFLSLPAAAGAGLIGGGRLLGAVGYLTIAVAIVAFAILEVFIWSSGSIITGDEWKPTVYSLLFAFLTGVVAVLLASANRSDSIAAHLARVTALASVTGLVIIAVVEIASPGADIDPRAISAIAVLFVAGVLSLFLLAVAGDGTGPAIADSGDPATGSS